MSEIVLFDLDGTLTDPAEGITKSVAYALNRYGIYVSDLSVLNVFIGPPLTQAFMHYFDFTKEQATQAVGIYREYFSQIGIFENAVYPGIPECLKQLCEEGKKLVLATSKPELYAKQILEHFSLMQYFEFVAGNTMEETRSKKSDVIEYIFAENPQFQKEKAVMVGDRSYDILGARECGIRSVGVRYGYAAPGELEDAGADYIAETVDELQKILMNIS